VRASVSDSEPPNTVKSPLNTKIIRPITVHQTITIPSSGTFVSAMPNPTARCVTNMSNSSNEPSRSNCSTRSRAVDLAAA
jgi:hypothetical protein